MQLVSEAIDPQSHSRTQQVQTIAAQARILYRGYASLTPELLARMVKEQKMNADRVIELVESMLSTASIPKRHRCRCVVFETLVAVLNTLQKEMQNDHADLS